MPLTAIIGDDESRADHQSTNDTAGTTDANDMRNGYTDVA